MDYKMTKRQYKKYLSDYKKTYIGKRQYIGEFVLIVASILVGLLLCFEIGYIDYLKNITLRDVTYTIILTLLFASTSLEAIIYNVNYKKDIEKYIISKK